MNKKIVLTSCGIINEALKHEFYKLLNKYIEKVKVLYITTAIDGEDDSDTSWIDEEFQTILDLGIKEEDLPRLAASAITDVCTPGNPREVTEEIILDLYKKVL